MNLSIIYRRFGEIYRHTPKLSANHSENISIIYRRSKQIYRLPGSLRATFSDPESTDNRPTFATNRHICCEGPANGVIKKMAELSATLYEQFACLCVACLRAARRQARRQAEADRLEAAIKRNLEVLGYGE